MDLRNSLSSFGLSQYALKAYLSLVDSDKPVNGSQLSVMAKIPRARIYDVLQGLKTKGIVAELEPGLYAPLPPKELVKRLRHRFDKDIQVFEELIQAQRAKPRYDYVWTISAYDEIISKAKEMISRAAVEIYIRVTPEEGLKLYDDLVQAEARGVSIKFIVLGEMPQHFEFQVAHHNAVLVSKKFGGRTIDIVVDKEEILAGVLGQGRSQAFPINWTKNRSFVISGRENLRHDYFHIFLHKIHDLGKPLSTREQRVYEIIKNDY
ncbi:TrmB family transcriptional regulator [Desulfosarcina sp.]|uniref:TrmB family transcriptional regulator n=1 Tax=Desulfosarcina sp. TaxID=2027861 RepID=UPI003970E733